MDIIIYCMITKGGGVDGLDYTDKGRKIIECSEDKNKLLKSKNLPWCVIEPIVTDKNMARKTAIAKLDAVDRFILGIK